MRTVTLTGTNIETCAARAANVLRAGGVVLYPTDTLYGLGADALSDVAVAKVYAIKARDEKKPMHAVVADLEAAGHYAELSKSARLLAEKFWPGALTLILKKKSGVDAGIANGMTTIGLRVPKSDFCLALAREFGRPYTTTSANLSGEAAGRDVQAIRAQIGVSAKNIDLVVDAGELSEQRASTVVDVSGEQPRILREGAVSAADVWDCLGISSLKAPQ